MGKDTIAHVFVEPLPPPQFIHDTEEIKKKLGSEKYISKHHEELQEQGILIYDKNNYIKTAFNGFDGVEKIEKNAI